MSCSRSHRQWRAEDGLESQPPGSKVCAVSLCRTLLLEPFSFPSFLSHFSSERVRCIRFLFRRVLDPVSAPLQICLNPAASQVLGCLLGSQRTSISTAVSLPTLYRRLPEHKAVPLVGPQSYFPRREIVVLMSRSELTRSPKPWVPSTTWDSGEELCGSDCPEGLPGRIWE